MAITVSSDIKRAPDNVTVDGAVTIVEPITIDDITGSVNPGTGATNLGKAEDSLHSSGDVGVMSLAVRNDAGTPLAGDGDYIPLTTDSTGALRVTGGTAGTVTADQGTPNTTANRWPVQLTDGTDLNTITAAGEVNVLSTAQPGVDIGDVTVNNAAGAGAVNIQDGGNVISVDDAGGSITVDGTVTADQGAPNTTANRWPVQLTDGTDLNTITAAGEVNVIATAQPGVDIGDVTVNNAAGAGAVNIQDGGNVISVDDAGGSITVDTPQLPATLVGGRLDENVGAWLGSTAPTVGQKLMASSVPVVIASDQSAVAVTGTVTTSITSANLAVTATAAVAVGVTLTLPAAGAGLFHHITRLGITVNTAPVALGANASAVVTSTNLPGSPAWLMSILRNGGGQDREDMPRVSPLKSSVANTATTIVAPATANAIWRLNVEYFTGT